ncbi:hypothetical protein [Curtobacterium sp. MCBD17_032]|uniref:hypothetical protein n=1 Tax=Curtobacterium sp. MCBD17_032 TaxID=2175659 RepID=UPI000DAFEB71|nr:hypothetical protein [Curtobacterium sp. MCBD17_032]PZE80406.1 hypothetical protein DEI91_14350 [Curtobacterium sp. MCBD17_032]
MALPVLFLLVRSDGSLTGPRSTTLGCALLLGLVSLLGDPRERRSLLGAFLLVGGALAVLALVQPASGHGLQVRTLPDPAFWSFIASPWATATAGLAVAVGVVALLAGRRRVTAAAVAIAWFPWGVVTTVTLGVSPEDPADTVIVAAGTLALLVGAVSANRPRPGRQRAGRACPGPPRR